MFFDEENIDSVDEYGSKCLFTFGYTWVDKKTKERDDGETWDWGYFFDGCDDEPVQDFQIKMKKLFIDEKKYTKEKAIAFLKEVEETGLDMEWTFAAREYRNVSEATRVMEDFCWDDPDFKPITTVSVACLQSDWLKSHFDIS